MKKKVYICAPLGGNVKENFINAVVYTEFALRSGVAPVTPHFYAMCLNDNKKEDREIGRSAGMSLLWFCDEMWGFGDVVSKGMQKEIDFCKTMNIRIRYINDNDLRKKLGGINYENEKN